MQTDQALEIVQAIIASLAVVAYLFPAYQANAKQPHWLVVYAVTTLVIYQASLVFLVVGLFDVNANDAVVYALIPTAAIASGVFVRLLKMIWPTLVFNQVVWPTLLLGIGLAVGATSETARTDFYITLGCVGGAAILFALLYYRFKKFEVFSNVVIYSTATSFLIVYGFQWLIIKGTNSVNRNSLDGYGISAGLWLLGVWLPIDLLRIFFQYQYEIFNRCESPQEFELTDVTDLEENI